MQTEKYSKYEKARIIGSRALQLSMGAPILVKMDEKELEKVRFNMVEIAKREFAAGAIPIAVKRQMPGAKEY